MDLKIFKTLLGVDKVDKTNQSINSAVNDDNSARKQNYKSLGFSDAGKVGGSEEALIPNLHAAKAKLQAELASDSKIQGAEQTRIRNEIARLKGEKDTLEVKKERKESDLDRAGKDIEDLRKEIASIKQDPTQVVENPTGKVGFSIGFFIICVLTVYLWIFYSSASYSAFFKQFTLNNIGVASAIFDAQALPKAFGDGFGELLLISTIPFVFLALGYLIHKFGEEKSNVKYLKIVALFFVTFIFDTILAYEITEKIYNLNAANSFQDMPEYSFSLAFSSINFWLIIFSGFVSYVIWGLVFDFVMESHAKLNVVRVKISEKEAEIRRKKKQCNEYKDDIEKIESEIKTKDIEIREKENELENVVYPVNILVDCLNSYLAGWINFLAGVGKAKNEQEQIRLTGQNTIGEISK